MTTEKYIPLHILEEITNEFSAHSRIGRGGYGDVYKGVYDGREIAVKLLIVDTLRGLDDQEFKNEVGNLLKVKHPNIVQLVGYCYETKKKYVKRNGANDFVEHIYRILCFEYMQDGSLDQHLYGQSFAPNWSTRYNIIKGICEGLDFLHKCDPQILHLDLKPSNILLDSSMEPKVADLGLSRLFTQSHTHVTEKIKGSWKYMPPEFKNEGKISPKNDVFSFGVVMMEIMTSSLGYSNSLDMDDFTQFKQLVLTNWSTVIEATSKYRSEEIDQVLTCIELAIRCVDSERDNRPTTSDILDALNKTEVNIPKRKLADEPSGSTIGSQNTTSESLMTIPAEKKRKLKMMTTEVEIITNKHRCYNPMPTDSFNTIFQQAPHRETSSEVEPTLIIGRTEEIREILSILSESNTKEIAILAIYGIGGIGKTTLAQLVFNDKQFKGYSRVWVHVSETLDLKKIGNSIISQLTNEISHISDMQMLHNRLGQLFACKSILIVLDDLWEQDPYQLDKLKTMLRLGQGTKVVIVTTRDEAIARKMSSTLMPYKLEILTNDMCWTIIKQKSFFEDRDDKEQLEQIGRVIAIKCGGVALAAQSLGYMLRDMESDQWESVRDSYIWTLSTLEDPSLRNHEVLRSLLLSYSHMHEFLQLCFSYCAVFPRGHNIVKYDLIHQWIALGLTGPSSTFDSIQLSEKYITQLLGMSFLQHSKTALSDGRPYIPGTVFMMHDLVHDLARAILADQVNYEGKGGRNKCRYALLTDCSKPLQLAVTSPENLRALHFLDSSKFELRGDAFSPATCLRVLNLSECFIQKLPDSIGHLKHLRFLNAPRIRHHMIPDCITELSELSYLNLRESENISALPESIGGMKGLVHLDLSGCDGLSELPASFAELKQLVYLDLSNCYFDMSEYFGGFTKLQYLNLSDYRGCMNVRGLSEVIGSLIKLKYLYLSGYMEAGSLLESISTLSNLEHLDLSDNTEITSIPESIRNLRKLHTLDLSRCYKLKQLPRCLFEMVSLKVLNLLGGGVLSAELSRLPFATLPHFVVHALSSDKCSSNINLLEPTNPDKLIIDRLENVKSAEEARRIKLVDKENIEDLTFKWTVTAERIMDDKEVLEKLVPPSSVKKLSIDGYRSVSIPYWLMGINQYLPHLTKIDLSDCPDCTSLPPLGQLPNLKLLSLSCMSSLEDWNITHSSGNDGVICRMEGLEEWNMAYTSLEEGANVLLFPRLESLSIERCAKLRIKPLLLARTKYFEIVDCDDMLVSSWGESSSHSSASSSFSITHLLVCNSELPLHQWWLLHQLPALSSLTITNCNDLTTSPEIMQHLSSLQSLSLQLGGNDQAELPTWLFELTSLPKLKIGHARLENLDENIRQLTGLQELCLDRCTTGTSLPWLGELASLRTITIAYCEGIMCLPDSIQQLTKLENISVEGCATLEEWCESELRHIRENGISIRWSDSNEVCYALLCGKRPIKRSFVVDSSKDTLEMDGLEDVSLGEVESLKLIEKKNVKVLRFKWTLAAERSVDDKELLEELVPPSSVQILFITGYSSAKFPDWLTGIRQFLPNLVQLSLSDFPKCNNLPPLGQLPNLRWLRLCRMEGLEDWNTAYTSGDEGANELMFSKLEMLIINQCAKLKLSVNTRQLTRLQKLCLSECESITSLPRWLGELSSLNTFEIRDCEGISSLPDSIQQLTNLEYLNISGCPALMNWCESKENKMKLAHIRVIEFFPRWADEDGQEITETDDLYNAVMNMPGFNEEALLVALSHLMDNDAQGSAYMGMQEEERVSWLVKFLKNNYFL